MYRANIANILLNSKSEILICERKKNPGSWQFLQGGINKKENVFGALYRETNEEIGVSSTSYQIIDIKQGYRYSYPKDSLKRKSPYQGQEQTYFLSKLHHDDVTITCDNKEFTDYRWILPENFEIKWVPAFKKDVYRQVFSDFFQIHLIT